MTASQANIAAETSVNLDSIRELIADDMSNVDTLIQLKLYSKVGLIDQLGHYIVNSGGKRLRRIGIVAVARKRLIALWRFIETGVLPEGAVLKEV